MIYCFIQSSSNCANNDDFEWKIVDRTSNRKMNDCLFDFDEDLEKEVPSTKHFSSKIQKSSSSSYSKKNTSNKHVAASSLPERSSSKWPVKNRRQRSSSTKSSTQHPSYILLDHFSQSLYEDYHSKCLDDRLRYGAGKSKEMNTLYRFWSHYLRSNFDMNMYEDFKELALEDLNCNERYGFECLFRFFSYGLEKSFNIDLLNDFQSFVVKDLDTFHCYGLEKFWAFLKYRKDQTSIDILPIISKNLLKISSLQDFKVLESLLQGKPIQTSPRNSFSKKSPRRRNTGRWVVKHQR